jgi:hypothetical protein
MKIDYRIISNISEIFMWSNDYTKEMIIKEIVKLIIEQSKISEIHGPKP